MNNDNEMRMISEKLNFFLQEKIEVHISLYNKKFYNGLIIEKVNDKIFLLKDRKVGIMHIFCSEIRKIEEFTEERK